MTSSHMTSEVSVNALVAAPLPLTSLPPDVQRAYDRYVADHFGDLSDPQGLALAMWRGGGRSAVDSMIAFGDLLPRLSHMEIRLQEMKALLHEMRLLEDS